MKQSSQKLQWMDDYIREQEAEAEEDRAAVFNKLYAIMCKFKPMKPGMKVFEVGCGTGWLCKYFEKEGLVYSAIEVNSQLVEYAKAKGANVSFDSIDGGAEELLCEHGRKYDAVVACSVMEHVEGWQIALRVMAGLLKKDGILFISTTNKWYPKSGEHPMPFYGWLPNRARYWIMRRKYGREIMLLGADFNQFTYGSLKKELESICLEVHDAREIYDEEGMTGIKKFAVKLLKGRLSPLVIRLLPNNVFVCIKKWTIYDSERQTGEK